MKKTIVIVLALLLVSVIAYMTVKVVRTVKKKNEISQQAGSLPDFKFYKQDKTVFTKDSLHDERVVIEYFSPDCEHCQYTAQQYLAAKEQLKDTRILMVTSGDSLAVANFYRDYQLGTMPNITVLRDPAVEFPKFFGAGMIPCFFVYKDNHLVNKFLGETRIPNLLSDTLIKL